MAKKWTSSEDNVLRNEVESFGQDATVSWIQIARKIPGRSNKDCRKRWDKIDDRWHRGAWSEAEDVRLKQAVETLGNRWAAVSEAVGTRNPNQCHKRWRNSLSPNLEKSLWTKADDDCLLAAVALYGRNWSSISQEYFRARSPLELSNRFASLSQKQRPPDSPDSSHQDPDDSNSDYVQDLLNTEAFHGIASSLVSSNPDSHPIGAVDDEHDWHDWLTTSEHNTPCTDSSRSTTVEFEVSQQSQSSLWEAMKPRNGSFSRVPTSETTMQSPRATVSPAFGTRNFTSNGVEAPNEAQVLPMGVGFDMPCPSHDWPRQSDEQDSALDAFPSNLGMKPGNNTTNNPNMTLTLENVDSETCGRVLQLICQRPGGTSLRVSIDEAFT